MESSCENNICDKCRLKNVLNYNGIVGNLGSEVMVVGGSSLDSPFEDISASIYKVSNNLNTPVSYYFTTAVKCAVDKKPTLVSIKKCNPYLKEELEILQPKFVLVLGEVAFKALLFNFDLVTRRKLEIESFAGTHIEKDGVFYFIVNDIVSASKTHGKKYAFDLHLKKFIKYATGKLKIEPVFYKEADSEKDLVYMKETSERTGIISIDIETDPDTAFLPKSEILTVSLTVKERESICIPLAFPTENYFRKWNFTPKVSPLLSISYLKKILKNPSVTKVFHNGAYDITWLEHILGCEVINYDDTMIMKYLMNQNDQERKGLKPLIKEYTDMGSYEYNIKQYVGPGESYSNIPPEVLIGYNNSDTDGTLRLYNIFKPKIQELKLENVHYGFMIPRLRGIINLQKDGLALDTEKCVKIKEHYENELIELFSKLKTVPQVANFERLSQMEFNPGSDKHKFAMVYGGELTTKEEVPRPLNDKGKKIGKKELKKLYYNGFNLEPILVSAKNAKTGKKERRKSFGKKAIQTYLKSVFKDVEYLDPINTFNLEPLPDKSDLIRYIKIVTEINTIQTQLSNHIAPFIDKWSKTTDRRVHTSYDITGTSTGRLASRAPNLQNLKRDGFVKEVFMSRWGNEGILIELDYKQLELFVMAIVSQDPKFVHAFLNDIDLHKKVAANIVFRVPEEKVTKQMRTMAKTVNFGMIYGKTAFTLCDDLNVTEKEAEVILNGYFKEYNGVYNYKQRIISQARSDGFVTTVMGRRRYLDYTDPNGADRQAVNTTIQSPASDVCVTAVSQQQEYFAKVAHDRMIKLMLKGFEESRIAVVCGTVHDSIIIDTKKEHINEVIQAAKLIMENTNLEWITIPLKVDVKYGPNLRHMEEWVPGEKIVFEEAA